MRTVLRLAASIGGFCCAHLTWAQLVAPPTVDWISVPSTATVSQTVNVGAGAHANLSDNSDGNDWNATQAVLAIIVIYVQRPGESNWTLLTTWLDPWRTPAEQWASFTVNNPGTHYVKVQVMDGRPWFSPEYTYAISVPSPAPAITSQLTLNVNQGQTVSYQITATGSPTSYGASGLPTGLSVNTSNGAITGSIPTNGGVHGSNSTVNSTITAANSAGTDSKTLVWNLTAAAITTSASVSPNQTVVGSAVTLTRAGSTNFGLAWTENVIWKPSGQAEVLGNQSSYGSQSYTPTAGAGTYYYQFRLVDTYTNYRDQWIEFTVSPPSPASFQSTSVLSTSVAFSWGAVSGASGYNLYRGGVKVNTTLITGTTHTDTPVTAGTAFSYTVRAVAGGVESANSTAVNVTTAAPLEIFTPAL